MTEAECKSQTQCSVSISLDVLVSSSYNAAQTVSLFLYHVQRTPLTLATVGVVWQELHKYSSFFFFFSLFTRGSANLTSSSPWLVLYKFYRKLCRKLTTR